MIGIAVNVQFRAHRRPIHSTPSILAVAAHLGVVPPKKEMELVIHLHLLALPGELLLNTSNKEFALTGHKPSMNRCHK